MKKMKKMIGFGLALAAVSLTACGGKKEAETIRIGVVCPRTGESSLFGDVLAETVELLAKQKNESGGILGKQIEIKVYDNRDDAVETTNAARKAVLNDKCVYRNRFFCDHHRAGRGCGRKRDTFYHKHRN